MYEGDLYELENFYRPPAWVDAFILGWPISRARYYRLPAASSRRARPQDQGNFPGDATATRMGVPARRAAASIHPAERRLVFLGRRPADQGGLSLTTTTGFGRKGGAAR